MDVSVRSNTSKGWSGSTAGWLFGESIVALAWIFHRGTTTSFEAAQAISALLLAPPALALYGLVSIDLIPPLVPVSCRGWGPYHGILRDFLYRAVSGDPVVVDALTGFGVVSMGMCAFIASIRIHAEWSKGKKSPALRFPSSFWEPYFLFLVGVLALVVMIGGMALGALGCSNTKEEQLCRYLDQGRSNKTYW